MKEDQSLRLVSSLELSVSFAEGRLFYRALLQKRPLILSSLLILATPLTTEDQSRFFENVLKKLANYRSLVQNVVSFIGLFCKRDLQSRLFENVCISHIPCCSVLQCVAACCSVLQCVAVCGSVLQRVAACCSVWQCVAVCCSVWQRVAACCRVLQCVQFLPAPYPSQSQRYRSFTLL